VLETNEQIEEFFFLGLRQREGIDFERAVSRWGAGVLNPWRARLATMVHNKLLEAEGTRVRLAPRAYLVSNEIFQEFLD
jgi:oxygen-independent coproporphyrinogen III oxidase